MQFTFSFVIERSSPAKLRHTAQTWQIRAIAPGIAAASAGSVGIYRLATQQRTELGIAVCQVNGPPTAVTVEVDGQVRESTVRGLASLGMSQLEYRFVQFRPEASR